MARSARAAVVCVAAFVALGAPASAATFSNTTPFTITDSPAYCQQQPASAYPSQIAVSGLPGVVTDVNVTITDFSHTYVDDVRMLLVGPGGQSTVLVSGPPSHVEVIDVTFTLDDEAAGPIGGDFGYSAFVDGTYTPTHRAYCFEPTNAFPAPAPAPPYGLALSAFDGTDPNGPWSLYVVDEVSGDAGSIQGWSLDVASGPAECNGVVATVVGSPGDDAALTGTAGDDVIAGLGGDDTIDGLGGND